MFKTQDFYDKIQDTISVENTANINKTFAQEQRIICDKNRQKPSKEDTSVPSDTKIYLRCRTGKIIKYLLSYELQSLEFNMKRFNKKKENLKSTYLHYITNNKLHADKISKILGQYLIMTENILNKSNINDIHVILKNIITSNFSDRINEIYIYLKTNKLIKLNKNLI